MNLLLKIAALMTLSFVSASALEIDSDYISQREWMLSFSIESTKDGTTATPMMEDIRTAAAHWTGASFLVSKSCNLSYLEPGYSDGNSVQLTPEVTRRLLNATCKFFQGLSLRNASIGKADNKDQDAVKIEISLWAENTALMLTFKTDYLLKSTSLSKDLAELLGAFQPYCPDWAAKLGKP